MTASTDADMARDCRLYGRPRCLETLFCYCDGWSRMHEKQPAFSHPFLRRSMPIVCNGCCFAARHRLPRYRGSGRLGYGDPVETGTHKAVSPLSFACYPYYCRDTPAVCARRTEILWVDCFWWCALLLCPADLLANLIMGAMVTR